MPQISEIIETSSSFLNGQSQFEVSEHENIFTHPSNSFHNTKVSTANFSLDNNHITSSFMTQLIDPTPPTFKLNYFPPIATLPL